MVTFAWQMRIQRYTIYIILLLSGILDIKGQGRLTNGLEYNLSAEMSTSFGDHTPLWLNANKYGLSSLDKQNGHLRVGIERSIETDSLREWAIGYGIDIATAYNYTSNFIIQQAYGEVGWKKGLLTVGSKQMPMELKNQELSSGSQTLGINARPIPQVRLSLPEYWTLPILNNWVSVKGHIAYGKMTDNNWQEDFAASSGNKYAKDILFHSKAGFIKIGNENKCQHFSLELGLEMACQFGGTSFNVTGVEGGALDVIENKNGLGAFWDAFIPGGSDTPEENYKNVSGNHLGSWMTRLNFDYDKWYLGIYGEHFFEDHSSMFFLDYDGYEEGKDNKVRKDNRYILYDFKDMMLGAEIKLKNFNCLNNIVAEYIYSKYQSGPIYHDHNINISDHIGGVDDYYNHSIYPGWQHWGQVIGNPLYLSPIYNEDGKIEIKNNRFYAFHLGLSGDPLPNLHYRVLTTYQKGWGTYKSPYTNPKHNVSVLAEAIYKCPNNFLYGGWSIRGAYGFDHGSIYGDNHGIQLTLTKTGIFDL